MTEPCLLYRVQPAYPKAHRFAVRVTIPPLVGAKGTDRITLRLPAWIPGSYMIRDFSRHLLALEARDDYGAVALIQSDKHTWQCSRGSSAIQIDYQVYAWDRSVRGAHLDTHHAYFNGACLLLSVSGYDQTPCQLELLPPPEPIGSDWQVATSLRPLDAPPWGYGRYQADSYAELIDHPVEQGQFERVEFAVDEIPHVMVISGQRGYDQERLRRDLTAICTTQATLFGELPLKRYLFLTQVVADGYGGLEHRDSCSLLCSRDSLPKVQQQPPTELEQNLPYRRFLGLCSHEYFHLWHVKRIQPAAFANADLSREVHTRLLWAFEGITAYYDDLMLVRSEVITTETYLGLLAETITRVMRTPGRYRQTLAAASFDAWTKFYQPNENSPNATISYYTKGALVALALDLTLRIHTQDQCSLDDLMRALWHCYGRAAIGVPERAIELLASDISGLNLEDFFAQALDSTQDLDLQPLLAEVGIEMRLRPALNDQDMGAVSTTFDPIVPRLDIGVRLDPERTEPRLAVVFDDRPAQQAGLAAGDVLVAVDGLKVTAANFSERLNHCTPDQPIKVHAFRDDELFSVKLHPQPAPADTCELRLMPDATDERLARRQAWLSADLVEGEGE